MNSVRDFKREILAKLGGYQNINKLYSDFHIRKIINLLNNGKITKKKANEMFLEYYNETLNCDKTIEDGSIYKCKDRRSEIVELAKKVLDNRDTSE